MAGRASIAAGLLLVLLGTASAADATSIKLWPLFDYERDPAAGTRSVKLFGPLVEYQSDPGYVRFFVRPVLSIRQARGAHDDEVNVLYPLISSHWGPTEQSTVAVGGLLAYHTSTTPDGRALTEQRFRALPFYFYDWDVDGGARASLIPVYADRRDFLGFDRVQMVLFPAYLKVHQPTVDRRFVLFPFFGDSGGALGRGHEIFPIWGREAIGDRYDSGFAFWPFYMWQTRTDDEGVERRWASFPFYAGVSGPERESRAYGTFLWVHALDRVAGKETWGFPWPLWMSEKSTTGDGRLLRLWPLYESSRQRPPDAFSLPALYRYRAFSDAGLDWSRGDGLFVVFRKERARGRAAGTDHRVEGVLPIYSAVRDGEREEGRSLSLVDGLWPEDLPTTSLYAPLWQAYAWDGPTAAPRWSVAWNAVTHDETGTHGPWRWETAGERASASAPPQPDEHSLPPPPDEYSLPAQPDEQLLPTQPDER